ncbi:MAG: PIG-L deacetylase family protein [Chloroflexota bacterium]
MRGLSLFGDADAPLHVLAIGAHADDIEIGAGGLLLELAATRPKLEITWVVLSGDDKRAEEARASAAVLLGEGARLGVETHAYRERFFPHLPELKERFDEIASRVSPDLVLAPRLEDRHQDHRAVAELVWQAFRDHLVLEYEIVKFEGDLGHPNLYVPLPETTAERKIEHIIAAYPSQSERRWFSDGAFRSILRLRGVECNAPTGYAEAFTARKLVADPRRA